MAASNSSSGSSSPIPMPPRRIVEIANGVEAVQDSSNASMSHFWRQWRAVPRRYRARRRSRLVVVARERRVFKLQ